MSESTPSDTIIPRHRFLPSESLTVKLSFIEPLIPPARLLRPAAPEETLDLPTASALAHVVPHISLRQLASLRPDFVEPSNDLIRLPVRSIAVSYPLKETPVRRTDEPFIPAIDARLHSPIANLRNLSAPLGEMISPLPEPPEALIADPSPEPPEATAASPATPPEALAEPLPRKLAEIFPNLPTFRRVEDLPPPTQLARPLNTTLESPHLPHQLPEDTQESLQALFHTEDELDLQKVVELCGSLPGIESCVLAHEERVLTAHNAPDGLDLVSLSSHASAMLRSMQDASAQMGIGDIPAVTLHTPKGPLSILQQDRLTLIVLHGKRGFIPGVREKMTATLAELTRTPLQLPAPPTRQALPPR